LWVGPFYPDEGRAGPTKRSARRGFQTLTLQGLKPRWLGFCIVGAKAPTHKPKKLARDAKTRKLETI
jgi:hypothetical protein